MRAMNVKGLTAVITGASRGLGAGMAAEFARHGMRLGLCARTPASVTGESVLSDTFDVSDGPAMDRFANRVAERFERIDLWINNAGVLEPILPLRDIEPEAFQQHLNVNVMGVFHGTRAFVRHLRGREGGGVLINISSGAGRNGYAGWSAYCASKAAVDLLTESVQLEERDSGLTAYALAPGVIDTDMQAMIRDTPREHFPLVDKFHELKANNAFATPEWVAERILDLAFRTPLDTVRVDLRT
jgi:NAD(P)-dependent dehydrogenase (short-subunit alcohol dehydrogenase family)